MGSGELVPLTETEPTGIGGFRVMAALVTIVAMLAVMAIEQTAMIIFSFNDRPLCLFVFIKIN